MRKVFLENLPKKGKFIDWKNSVGYSVNFIYDTIEDDVKIKKYDLKTRDIYIKYKNKDLFRINIVSFQKCCLGKLLGKYTDEFRVEIGQVFKDDKRDIIITDRKYKLDKSGQNYKYYKYKCNKCGYDQGWILESNLLKRKVGCSYCGLYSQASVGINDIPTTDPWMIPYFQGGYEEAKMYTKSSNLKIYPICPDCGRIKDKEISIYQIYNKKSIGCLCGDGKSYPEKFVIAFLEQLKINFETEKTFIEKNKRYDFYIPSLNCIIETHGEQHYIKSGFSSCGGKTLEEEQENDRLKERLAKENGIEHYIVIDCRRSELEWIKNNILNSDLVKLFDLSDIDWLKCEEFACSNLVKYVCDLWNDGVKSSRSISKIIKISHSTVLKYLKIGTQLNWCNYSKKIAHKTKNKSNGNYGRSGKKVINLNTGKLFKSAVEGAKFYNIKCLSNISRCCKGERNYCGNDPRTGDKLRWMFYEDYLLMQETINNK